MDRSKLADYSEIISSIAVVITLIYLSIQTHQTNAALRANSQQATMIADVTLVSALINSPEVSDNFDKPLDQLTQGERGQIADSLAGLLRIRQFAWLQYKSGILDGPTFDSYMETPIRLISAHKDYQYYWKYFSSTLDPEFVSYVNSKLKQTQ